MKDKLYTDEEAEFVADSLKFAGLGDAAGRSEYARSLLDRLAPGIQARALREAAIAYGEARSQPASSAKYLNPEVFLFDRARVISLVTA